MVKSTQPLQIRLTEPVIFLRGPSTGLDFRGRPQGVDPNAPPAMLRGLLTLRLSKPTRIRCITVKLDGRSRTEWPEGIGPRRLETYEEHQLINETTTFFDARRRPSRSQSARRASSLGPNVGLHDSDHSSDELDSHLESPDLPTSELTRGRERERVLRIPRSASALPGVHDQNPWHRDGFSRRGSYDGDTSRHGSTEMLPIPAHILRERGPSPAYTPTAEHPPPSLLSETLRGSALSPIQSAAPSRTASDRDGSADTQGRHRLSETRMDRLPSDTVRENREEGEGLSESPSAMINDGMSLGQDIAEEHHHAIRSILAGASTPSGRSSTGGEVRFAAPARSQPRLDDSSAVSREPEAGPSRASEYHPIGTAALSAVSTAHNSPAPSRPQSIHEGRNGSLASGMRNMHIDSDEENDASDEEAGGPSAPPPNRRQTSGLSTSTTDESSDQAAGASHSAPPSHPPSGGPSAASSRRSSLLLSRELRSAQPSAASSSSSLSEIRQGRKNRLGSHSTIVINNDPNVAPLPPVGVPTTAPARSSPLALLNGVTHPAGSSTGAGADANLSPYGQPSGFGATNQGGSSSDERGRRGSKFSFAATLRGLSQDVKDRVRASSKSQSRTRQPSDSFNRSSGSISGPSSTAAGKAREPSSTRSRPTLSISSSFLPPHLDRAASPTPRPIRSGSFTQNPDFVPPHGRGGAGKINHSRERRSRDRENERRERERGDRERTLSPVDTIRERDRSESTDGRGRGRNKGMKALTGKLGLGELGTAVEEEIADVHNWKEFRKGTYNYPISFPIPVSTPPTIHAEFGSVAYRLKATVVRVGALTSNLTEEVEVMMIASPQEDDLEESENVIVERQWEEQMRYQIALSGKAFPIGGSIIRLMPLMKCKVHRLSVLLEEKTDYYAQGRKVVRHEAPRKFLLLFIKQPDKKERIEPLLPIISPDPNAPRDSPLAELARNAALNNPAQFTNFAGEHDEDALYAGLMDPMGPWHLESELVVPDCANKIRFSTKHETTNIAVAHWMKVTIRVERGDDEALDSKGRRKLFDIIIETPVKILDCRVNPQWNSLPTYSSYLPSSTSTGGMCSIHGTKSSTAAHPSHHGPSAIPGSSSFAAQNHRLSGDFSHPPSHIGGVGVPSGVVMQDRRIDGLPESSISRGGRREEGDDTLLERNIVFDRLVSGQETEMGDVPPTYGEAVAGASSVSVSRQAGGEEVDGSLEGSGRGREPSLSGAAGRGRGSPRGSVSRLRDDRAESGSRSRSRLRQEM